LNSAKPSKVKGCGLRSSIPHSAVLGPFSPRRWPSIRANPSRQGSGEASVTWTISWPGMATVPDENALMPGKKR
jgi:hypothetical protein